MTRAIAFDTRFTRAIATLIAALMLIITAGPARAHHGWSDYDPAKRATITELRFSNPSSTAD